MAEGSRGVPGLRPVLGRLANAMVAVLGPEMKLGSPAYTKTRTLLLDLQVRRLNFEHLNEDSSLCIFATRKFQNPKMTGRKE